MNVGRNLLNAASVLRVAATQIEELFGEFSNFLAGTRTHEGIGFRASNNQPDPESFRGGWAQNAWRLTLLATNGGKRVRKGEEYGEITLAMDLGRDKWLSGKVGEACIYVLWAASGDSWTGSIDEGDFFPTQELYSIIDKRIFVWTGEDDDGTLAQSDFADDPLGYTWFFVIPLAAIDSRRKVHELLAQPIVDLVEGKFQGLNCDHPAVQWEWQAGEPNPIRTPREMPPAE